MRTALIEQYVVNMHGQYYVQSWDIVDGKRTNGRLVGASFRDIAQATMAGDVYDMPDIESPAWDQPEPE